MWRAQARPAPNAYPYLKKRFPKAVFLKRKRPSCLLFPYIIETYLPGNLSFSEGTSTHLAENPLLPHRRLQELHALMLRCRDLDRKNTRKNRGTSGLAREGLLAAAAIQMEPGDMLCGETGDATVEELFLPQSAVSKQEKTSSPKADLPAVSQLTL